MGGRRLTPGESVRALEEAIDIIRALWDTREPRGVTYEGTFHAVRGAARGPAPAHDVGIWIGAYKPRMLALDRPQGRRVAAEPVLHGAGRARRGERGDRRGGARRRARARGGPADRSTSAARSRRGAATGCSTDRSRSGSRRSTALALEDGVVRLHPPGRRPGGDRDVRRRGRARGARGGRRRAGGRATAAARRRRPSPSARRARTSTSGSGSRRRPDDGTRITGPLPWDEASRPHRAPSGPDVRYTPRGRAVGRHLIDVHDMLRTELERAARDRRPGPRRRARRRRRPLRPQRDGDAAERLDARRVLRALLHGRRPAPRPRGRRRLPASRARRRRAPVP